MSQPSEPRPAAWIVIAFDQKGRFRTSSQVRTKGSLTRALRRLASWDYTVYWMSVEDFRTHGAEAAEEHIAAGQQQRKDRYTKFILHTDRTLSSRKLQ